MPRILSTWALLSNNHPPRVYFRGEDSSGPGLEPIQPHDVDYWNTLTALGIPWPELSGNCPME